MIDCILVFGIRLWSDRPCKTDTPGGWGRWGKSASHSTHLRRRLCKGTRMIVTVLGSRNSDRCWHAIVCRGTQECFSAFINVANPILHIGILFCLQVVCSSWEDHNEAICMSLQSNRGARMNVWQIKKTKKLVFRRWFVNGYLCRAEDKPALFPGLEDVNTRVIA